MINTIKIGNYTKANEMMFLAFKKAQLVLLWEGKRGSGLGIGVFYNFEVPNQRVDPLNVIR